MLNYRIIEEQDKDESAPHRTIARVWYREDGTPKQWEAATVEWTPTDDPNDKALEIIEQLRAALTKPVLTYRDF